MVESELMNKAIPKNRKLQIFAKQSTQLALGLAALATTNPVWSILFLMATTLINSWGEFGQARVEELVNFIVENKKLFKAEILKSDRFKSVFLNIIEKHIKEASAEKRRLLREYLLNVGKGIHPKFNADTKLMITLDQITPEELQILQIWTDSLLQSNIKKKIPSFNPVDPEVGLNEHQMMFAFDGKSWPSMDDLKLIVKSLRNYGLLDISEDSGTVFGHGGDGLRVKRLTPFGREFLDYLSM